MKLENSDLLLYLVTDRRWLKEENLVNVVEKAIKNGVSFVQIREKELDHDKFKEIALEIKRVTDHYNIPFVVNDNIDLAIEIDADGVHIGQDDIAIGKARKLIEKDKIFGVSVGNLKEAIEAESKGADYLGVGAVFSTDSKTDAIDVSQEELKDIKAKVNIPVIAIGGISFDNLHLLEASNIDGVAVISAILAQKDIEKASKDLKILAEKYLGGK